MVEVLKQLPAVDGDPVAAATIDALLGNQKLVTSSEEIAWAFRKQLEAVAREQPVVCVFDDLHWGEATFLDLVEHVADLSRGAPILLLCMARPDLLDRRTGWGGGKVNATTVLLEPLAAAETALLIGASPSWTSASCRSPGRCRGQPAVRRGDGRAAAGVGRRRGDHATDDSGAARRAPRPTRPAGAKRTPVRRGRRANVSSGSGAGLIPEETDLTARLTALVRKELIRPETAVFRSEEAFRFRHLLSRDAAYDGLPKATRAELHERFAAWLGEHQAGLVELDELLGYHLEQAARFNEELGRPGAALAERAAGRLGAAGVRALDRGDMVGAINLLGRATALLPPDDDARIELELELGEALQEAGRLTEAESLLEQTALHAARSDQHAHAAKATARPRVRSPPDERREGASDRFDASWSRWCLCSRRRAITVTRRTHFVCSG